MIQLYNPDNTTYSNNGDITLTPSSATVHPILNGAWTAELAHPIDPDGRWKSIVEEAVVKMPSFNGDQLFRIKDVQRQDSGVTAEMEPIFYDSMNDCWLTDIRPNGKNGQEALELMLSPNNKYSASSNITKSTTAYYQYRNFMEALNGDIDQSFIKRWGGEILFDNFAVIVNEHVGGDYGVELRYGKNIPKDGMSIEIDIRDVVTRIYPKGYNGAKMSGDGYVDSPLINKYPISKTTTITFDNIKLRSDLEGEAGENDIVCDNQTELDAALAEACNAEYEAGLDKPKVSITANMVLLQYTEQYKDIQILETVSLGDTVHCRNTHLDIVSDARVIELEYDSIRKKVSSVVLGDYEYNYFNDVTSSTEAIQGILNPDGTVMAERVQGILNGIYTQLRLQSTAAQKVNGVAFKVEELDESSPLYGCMIWGTQGIQISTTRTQDGRDWDWTTAITANGIVANAIVTGLLTDKTGNNYWNLDTGEFQLSSTTTIDGNPIATADQTIKSVDVEYAVGDSNTTAPTSGWSTDSPQWQAGKYIWQRTVTVMADNTQSISEPTCIQGAAGENGAPGAPGTPGADGTDGVGVSQIYEQYYLSTSSTTQTGGSWSTNQPAWVKGRYIWTRSVVTWTNNTTTYTDPVLAKAINGANQAVSDLDDDLDQQGVFNRLTNNGQTQGIYLQNGRLYINGTYIGVGKISSHNGQTYFDLDGNRLVINGPSNGQFVVNTPNFKVDSAGNVSVTGSGEFNGTFNVEIPYGNSGDYIIDLASGKITMGLRLNSESDPMLPPVSSLVVGQGDSQFTSGGDMKVYATGQLLLGSWGFGNVTIDTANGEDVVVNQALLAYQNVRVNNRGRTVGISTGASGYAGLYDFGDSGWILSNMSGTTRIPDNLIVSGTKSRAVDTQNFGERLFYCHESATPMFGDIGEGQTDESGVCYIDLDPIVTESISDMEYQVFIQPEGEGSLYVPRAEKTAEYFVVRGTPNLSFCWEIKARQKNYEDLRLEETDNTPNPYVLMTDDAALEYVEKLMRESEAEIYGYQQIN